MKTLPVKLLEPKNIKIEYEIAWAVLEHSVLSNGGRKLINYILIIEYKVVLLEMTFDKTFMAAKKP